MKTYQDKIAKHIRKLNEILGIQADPYDTDGATITLDLLKALAKANDMDNAFTTNAVDEAILTYTKMDY